jgi:hypothetical protein
VSPDTCHAHGLDLARMTIDGGAEDAFAATARSCPDVLLPGNSCAIAISFSPRSTGTFDARLTIPAAGPDQPGVYDTIPLTGTSVRPRPSTPTQKTPTAHAPVIGSTSTYQEGVLIYVRINYADQDNDAEGLGFNWIVAGRDLGTSRHPFADPDYGRVSPGRVDYPFNHACGTSTQYESDVRAFIYDRTGRQSTPVTVHLTCS